MTSNRGIRKLQTAFHLKADVPMGSYTRFRVGGTADLLALPRTRQDLVAILTAARNESVQVTLVGGGCNLLVSDQGVRGLVVVTAQLKSGIRCEKKSARETHIAVETGERLSTVCQFAVSRGLSGLEFCAGIPGTMGGAIMMNAGTATRGIGENIHCLDVLDMDTLTTKTLEKQDLVFSYRRLALENHVILGMDLSLKPGDPDQIKQIFDVSLQHKQKNQPMDLPSAGCFFKNPGPDMPAGKLIEDAGLKGKAVRDAQVSEIHANYIVNRGNATCQDILDLTSRIQKHILTQYGIALVPEVKVIGNGVVKNE